MTFTIAIIQDFHYLLELVQNSNADDNSYPAHVKPTLALILQSTGGSVLSNELGFIAKYIRDLCDVSNSSKKGSNPLVILHRRGLDLNQYFGGLMHQKFIEMVFI